MIRIELERRLVNVCKVENSSVYNHFFSFKFLVIEIRQVYIRFDFVESFMVKNRCIYIIYIYI